MPGCIQFKEAPLEFEDEMRILFDSICVINATSFVPGGNVNASPPQHIEGNNDADVENEGEDTPSLAHHKRSAKKRHAAHGASPKEKKGKKTYRDGLMKRLVDAYEKKSESSTNSATSTIVDHMSTPSDTEQSDEVMAECDSDDDDDFLLVYAALELMDDNYDSCCNKERTVPRMSGNVWTEILLQDRDKGKSDIIHSESRISSKIIRVAKHSDSMNKKFSKQLLLRESGFLQNPFIFQLSQTGRLIGEVDYTAGQGGQHPPPAIDGSIGSPALGGTRE
ncbi:hypothetical protein PR202_ga17163 [Eleusine coracana subsp. coracana]|uniref:Uncharacterized protein n=1 Tax=Eleusine coracana subsp. coracana TaxID=191504 RepID=A0AAV5CPJ6_ELECO|nr:hypothetical protein PR202_ga17163 [Eleusine coracana subsp. coracana]